MFWLSEHLPFSCLRLTAAFTPSTPVAHSAVNWNPRFSKEEFIKKVDGPDRHLGMTGPTYRPSSPPEPDRLPLHALLL